MLLCSFVPLALSLALLTLIFWTCYQYPYRFLHGDRNFLERWSFIFDRFHPKTYYFALILKLGSEKQSHLEGFVCVKKWMVKAFGFEKETFLLWLTSVNLDAFTEAPEGLSIRLLKTITIVSSNLYVFFNDDS